jgi:hypothetical protein
MLRVWRCSLIRYPYRICVPRLPCYILYAQRAALTADEYLFTVPKMLFHCPVLNSCNICIASEILKVAILILSVAGRRNSGLLKQGAHRELHERGDWSTAKDQAL